MRSAELRRDDSYLIDRYRKSGWTAFIAVADIDPCMFLEELNQMRKWCEHRHGPNQCEEQYDIGNFDPDAPWFNRHRLFAFREPTDAVEFRMTWG